MKICKIDTAKPRLCASIERRYQNENRTSSKTRGKKGRPPPQICRFANHQTPHPGPPSSSSSSAVVTRISFHLDPDDSQHHYPRASKSLTMTPPVILTTGANQGLGLAIVHVLAQREPTGHYILCARNTSAGDEALAGLRRQGIRADIEVLQLDVTNDDQIQAAIDHVQSRYQRLDGKQTHFHFAERWLSC